uniref:Protein kinase domain-containing protein n=1 Tax=Oryza glumipatula TaxID=40148 RepID=A0A0E0B795_9ORYZ
MEHPSSFYVECEALKSIRHRNLVRVIGLCSTFDTSGFEFKALFFCGDEFKALVLEFRSNGNLEVWINPKVRSQSPPKLLRVAADIATALDYLHNRCTPPLVHCDLKPSNILLNDESFSDFGLAKFLQNNIISLGDASSTTRLRGSIGYIAPEPLLSPIIMKEDDTIVDNELKMNQIATMRIPALQ